MLDCGDWLDLTKIVLISILGYILIKPFLSFCGLETTHAKCIYEGVIYLN